MKSDDILWGNEGRDWLEGCDTLATNDHAWRKSA